MTPADKRTPCDQTKRAACALARCMDRLATIHILVVDSEGAIQWCNAGFASRFGLDDDRPGPQESLWDYLPAVDARSLRHRMKEEAPKDGAPFLLNFAYRESIPFTLECNLDNQGDGFVLVGELPRRHDEQVPEEMMVLNNQLAVLSRENERKRKALVRTEQRLQATLHELETSYWHLKKLQEVLPTCMHCGKVKTGEHTWDDAIEYLRQNSLFLSHGYCPSCEGRLLDDLGDELGKEV
jgi:hypothetical protein